MQRSLPIIDYKGIKTHTVGRRQGVTALGTHSIKFIIEPQKGPQMRGRGTLRASQ